MEQSLEKIDPFGTDGYMVDNVLHQQVDSQNHNVTVGQDDHQSVNNLQIATNDNTELVHLPITNSADDNSGNQSIINESYDSEQNFEQERLPMNALNEEIAINIDQLDSEQNTDVIPELVWISYWQR